MFSLIGMLERSQQTQKESLTHLFLYLFFNCGTPANDQILVTNFTRPLLYASGTQAPQMKGSLKTGEF